MKWFYNIAKENMSGPSNPVFFDVQNIAQWLETQETNEGSFKGCVIPPWTETWMQYKLGDKAYGALHVHHVKKGDLHYRRTHVYSCMGDKATLFGSIEDVLDKDGKQHVGDPIQFRQSKESFDLVGHDEEAIKDDIVDINGIMNYAFMFCHVKNVTIEDIEPPAAVQKKRKKKGKPPLDVYKRLSIALMGSHSKGKVITLQKNRFHIFRGHFKDYSQGKGLFGKLKGVYYWEMGTRGNKKLGTVTKEYVGEVP